MASSAAGEEPSARKQDGQDSKRRSISTGMVETVVVHARRGETERKTEVFLLRTLFLEESQKKHHRSESFLNPSEIEAFRIRRVSFWKGMRMRVSPSARTMTIRTRRLYAVTQHARDGSCGQ